MKAVKKLLILLSSVPFFFSLTSCLSLPVEDFLDPKLGQDIRAVRSVIKATEEITPEDEYLIGRSVAANLIAAYPVYENKSLEVYLNSICQVIVSNTDGFAPYDGYHVKVLNTTEVNAFATSGGHILITRGMINCARSEDDLAFIIAHEVSHIVKKHNIEAIKTNRITNATKEVFLAVDISEKDSPDLKQLKDFVGNGLTELVDIGYSQEQEFEADALAVTLMNAAGYNVQGAINVLNYLRNMETANKNRVLSTHPEPQFRINKINRAIKKLTLCEDTSEFRVQRFNNVKK